VGVVAGADRLGFRPRAVALAALVLSAAISCGGGGGGNGRGADDGGSDATTDGAADLAADRSIDGPASVDAASAGSGDAPTDVGTDASGPDVVGSEPGPDGAPAGTTCTDHTACAGLPAGPTLPHCGSSYFSCVQAAVGQPGRCVRECTNPPRTCVANASACIVCNAPGSQPSCPGQACTLAGRPFTVESTSCPVTPSFDLGGCRGDWLVRSDGSICAIQGLATGLIRFAIACPECTTIVVQQ
jgi:hypothetical protein